VRLARALLSTDADRIPAAIEAAGGFLETTSAEKCLATLLPPGSSVEAIADLVLHLDHVGCMASPEEKSDLGAATEAAGFPQQRTFPSTVFARQLAELAGHQVPTTIFEARGGAAQGPIGVEFAIPSRIEQDVIEGWIRSGIGAHIAFSVTDPSVFEQLRSPMRSAGYQVSEFMNGTPASNPAAGVTLLYFDRRPAEPLGIEFCYSARSKNLTEVTTSRPRPAGRT
jgi:hypothetical protein